MRKEEIETDKESKRNREIERVKTTIERVYCFNQIAPSDVEWADQEGRKEGSRLAAGLYCFNNTTIIFSRSRRFRFKNKRDSFLIKVSEGRENERIK